jgi:histidinol dehydrogenase
MIKIYTVDEAKATILRRDLALEPAVPESVRDSLFHIFGQMLSPDEAVKRILSDVRQRGDNALKEWMLKIDGVELSDLAVTQPELERGLSAIPGDLADALRLAASRIREFHSHQPLPSWTVESMGGRLGQRLTPLHRVGVYVPGGTAPLPSSLLMSVIPAQVAGVQEIVVATPPGREDGQIPDVILAAARIAGIETVYKLGGAQAIAALAFGTETISRVDKVVGAGNLFVTLAKRQVYGIVGIDGLHGPTETVVIADESANPAWVAADLLAQAEHDVLATAILFTDSPQLASEVQVQVGQQMELLSRSEIIAASLKDRGGIIVTEDLDQAAALANRYAPEHLCIATTEPAQWVDRLDHAGGLFIGERSFEVLGDYVAGPSHVMPTSGTARFASPLSAIDFVRITSIVELDEITAARLSPVAAMVARSERLTAHASAAMCRADDGE